MDRAPRRCRAGRLPLTLGPPLVLTGRVIDDRGEPLERFTLHWESTDELAEGSRSFRKAAGEFHLDELGEGTWLVFAEARGHAASHEVRVRLPHDGSKLELALPRLARLEGLVVDPRRRRCA
jgi:hypothetical protein